MYISTYQHVPHVLQRHALCHAPGLRPRLELELGLGEDEVLLTVTLCYIHVTNDTIHVTLYTMQYTLYYTVYSIHYTLYM